MTVMFRPPIAASISVGWAEVLGFDRDDDPFWGKVRAAQLASIDRYMPFNIACMAINLATSAFVLRDVGGPAFMAVSAIILGGLCGLWLIEWHGARHRPERLTASQVRLWLAMAKVLAFGLWWSLLVLHVLPLASVPQQMYLMLASIAVMGAWGLATAFIPGCSIAVAVMIGGATALGIPPGTPLAAWPTMLCLATFVIILARGVMFGSYAMITRMQADIEHSAHNEVIALLLGEFEANGSDWLFEIDAGHRLTHVSPRFAQVAGLSREAMLGRDLLPILGSAQRGAETRLALRSLTEHLARVRPFRDIVVPVSIAGETRWWQLSGSPKRDARGGFSGFRGVGSDITDIRMSHERIAHLARFDPLTGLANRSLLRERLEDALARAVRTSGGCALLFVDLDRFKIVNDTLGHLSGDRLLREVAARLRNAMGAEAHIGRLGGDEFAIVLPESSVRRAEAASKAIVATLSRPFVIDNVPVSIGASVGFALGPDDGASVDVLLRSADLALDQVKGSGRVHSCRFMPAIQERADERRSLEGDLREALKLGQLRLAFQPVVDAADETIVGFEALLRWHHPVLGLIPPLKFIPIAEETGIIVAIGEWVIRTACSQAAAWPDQVRIAVNLSPVQFDDPDLATIVRNALAENGLAPDRLELEITESLFLNEQASTVAMLAELKAIGIRFALDDFGTGYSSLGYLQKVAFSRIKIDRSFVARSTVPQGESAAIIQAIVALANSLGMTTTAEGTETREEFEVIRALGCLQVQGYLFGRPMTPEEATALVVDASVHPGS